VTTTFELSPALRAHGQKLRDWSRAEVRPYAREADRRHAPPAHWPDIIATCPVPIGRRRHDRSEAARFPEGRWVRELVVTESINYGDLWVGDVIGSGIGHLVVRLMGTPDQIQRWYQPVLETGGPTGFALTEPGFGSDTSMVATTATRDGDTWVLNGSKMYCSYGGQADYVVVFATTDRSIGPSAIRAFVVPRGTPGFSVPKLNEDKLGIRSWTTSELLFTDCVIPVDHQLGWTGDEPATARAPRPAPSGRSGALGALAQNKPNISALGIAITQASLDVASGLLHEQRGGYAPHRWALVANELDRMNEAIGRARRLNFQAQWLQDKGRPNKTEASMAKAYGPPTFERVIRRCMQLLGPEGASTDLLLEKWYRDIKILDIFEGSGQVQRIIVGRAVFGLSTAGRV
jgi:acyl-CoA dehydrogenase